MAIKNQKMEKLFYDRPAAWEVGLSFEKSFLTTGNIDDAPSDEWGEIGGDGE